MAEELSADHLNDGIDKVVRPELEAPLGALIEVIRSTREEVQAQSEELERLADGLDELGSNYAALQHGDKGKYEQVQTLAAMEKMLREIQNLRNMIGAKDSQKRLAIQEMIRYIETALEEIK